MMPPKAVCSWRPISIHSSERMPGAVTIISSKIFSLGNLLVISNVGFVPTFQIACFIGMMYPSFLVVTCPFDKHLRELLVRFVSRFLHEFGDSSKVDEN